ncbi:MAG TPA: DUF4190 domain-containing protein [Streptosporangiaceae bacterium]|nr:DUF4190 domain-containing protein [Streptosporangiaceae bacterium]
MARSQTKANDSVDQLSASARTNRMAIWSLVLSIVSIGGIGSIAGMALGVSAHRRASETGERGRGMAIAAVVIGVITLLLSIAYWAYLGTHFNISPGHGGGFG